MKHPRGYDVLGFVEAMGPHGRTFLEPTLNRRPLSKILERPGLMGVFGWQDAKIERRFAFQLLRREPSELPSGRVPLYICGECGDLGCGCIAVLVTELEECVIWSSFSNDNPLLHADTSDELAPSFPDVRDHYFLRGDYEEALARFSAGYRMRAARR